MHAMLTKARVKLNATDVLRARRASKHKWSRQTINAKEEFEREKCRPATALSSILRETRASSLHSAHRFRGVGRPPIQRTARSA